MFRIRIQRYTEEITTMIDVGVCISQSAVRKRTAESAIIGKGVNKIQARTVKKPMSRTNVAIQSANVNEGDDGFADT